jgi:hypothetical protein
MLVMVMLPYFSPSESYFQQSPVLYGCFVVILLAAMVLMLWSVGVALTAPKFPLQPRHEKTFGWYLCSYCGSAISLCLVRLIWKNGPQTLWGFNFLFGLAVITFSLVMLYKLWKNIPVTA